MAQHGKGKQAFREFTKAANTLKRMIKNAVSNGETYTEDEAQEQFDDLLQTYFDEWVTIGIDTDLWEERATDYISEVLSQLVDSGDLQSEQEPIDDNEEQEELNPFETPDIEGFYLEDGTFIRIISQAECLETKNSKGQSAKTRGQILLTFDELIEYFRGIPSEYIVGIVPVYANGKLQGFQPCIKSSL